MRRMLLVLTATALVAMMMAASAAPAMARHNDFDDFDGFNGFDFDGAPVSLGVENEAESGGVDISFGVSNEGDFASQCAPANQFVNTGNFNNAPSGLQFSGEFDDFESGGIEFVAAPEADVECSSTIQQSSAASSRWW